VRISVIEVVRYKRQPFRYSGRSKASASALLVIFMATRSYSNGERTRTSNPWFRRCPH